MTTLQVRTYLLRKAGCVATCIAALIAACGCGHENKVEDDMDLAALYQLVDTEIQRSEIYEKEKEKRINILKQNLNLSEGYRAKLRIYDNLIGEYEAFVCDSALKYVEEARKLAEESGDTREQMRLLLRKADIASHAGLFTEAHGILENVNRNELDSSLLNYYYSAHSSLYQYESEYLPRGEYTDNSKSMHNIYLDSIMSNTKPGTFSYLITSSNRNIADGNFEKARKDLEAGLEKYEPGNRNYSIIASTIAHLYEAMGDADEERRYLSMTVISDIRGAVKENMAIRELATRVFEDGDIDRANRYMKASLDDANFFAVQMNSAQSSRMLPVIDRAYDRDQKMHQKQLRDLIYITSALLILAIAALVIIRRQMIKVKEANRKESQSNEELQRLSVKLQKMNDALEKTNQDLKNSNRTAEEYAALFMEYTSLTISHLEKYHLGLRNLAHQGNMKGLAKKLESDISTETLKSFYQKFDEAILNIYPQFAEKVNTLLKPDGQSVIKSGEKLNTELRILALIRIGILDSEKISKFLRCSITTIYTYRSKLKRRALNPDTFEREVMEI